MATEAEKAKRVSFTMRKEYMSMLSDLAEKNLTTVSAEIRRLIKDEWDRTRKN